MHLGLESGLLGRSDIRPLDDPRWIHPFGVQEALPITVPFRRPIRAARISDFGNIGFPKSLRWISFLQVQLADLCGQLLEMNLLQRLKVEALGSDPDAQLFDLIQFPKGPDHGQAGEGLPLQQN